jgi:predicted transcriptional regulator
MSNEFLRNRELSLKAKGLLAVCLSLPDTWEYSMKGLVAISKESITAIRNSMRELEEHGYMKVNKLKNDKGQFYYEYVIYENPEPQKPVLDKLDIDNVDVDNVDIENQDIENVNQLNIKESNTKELNIDKLNLYIKEHASAAILSPLYDYLEMRKEIGTPLDMRSLKVFLTRLEKLSNNNINIQRLMLENATMNKWKNVYKPKDQEIEAASQALINELRQMYNI